MAAGCFDYQIKWHQAQITQIRVCFSQLNMYVACFTNNNKLHQSRKLSLRQFKLTIVVKALSLLLWDTEAKLFNIVFFFSFKGMFFPTKFRWQDSDHYIHVNMHFNITTACVLCVFFLLHKLHYTPQKACEHQQFKI